MDSFEAELKLSWFSVRESLRGVTGHNKLWVPTTVTLVGDSVRISTSEGVDEFRVRRLIWNGPESFLITGLRGGSKFKRALLRFPSPSETLRAASVLKEWLEMAEQSATQVEEIRVEARFLFSTTKLFFQAYAFLVRLVMSGFVVAMFSALGTFGLLFGVGVVLVYVGADAWTLFERRRRRVQAWLRFDEHSLTVRTRTNFTSVMPRVIEWKDSGTFLLKGPGLSLLYRPRRRP